LYFVHGAQEIAINCKNQKENKIIRNISKITLGLNCKLTIPKVMLKIISQLNSKFIMAHFPKFNIISIQETNDKNNVKPLKKLKLK